MQIGAKSAKKRVSNVYIFQLSFHFAYHRWWLGASRKDGKGRETRHQKTKMNDREFASVILSILSILSTILAFLIIKKSRLRKKKKKTCFPPPSALLFSGITIAPRSLICLFFPPIPLLSVLPDCPFKTGNHVAKNLLKKPPLPDSLCQ